MQTSKLMFNDISSRAKADNPKYIKEYNITVNKIGLSKARLDTSATWKTNGMISTRRKINGIIYSQVYLVKPMAANADVKASIQVNNSYILKEDQEEILIPIKYGLEVQNMTGYADQKHIKEIKAGIYINNKKVDEISGSKITSVGNQYMLVITRDEFPPNKNHSVDIKIDGYMHTEFAVDGLMRDSIIKTISVYVEPKLIIPVKEANVMSLEKDALEWVVSPLAQTHITNAENSIGFTEAGKYLAVKLDLNLDVSKINSINVYLDEEVLNSEVISKKDRSMVIKIKLPKDTYTTLYGIDSLRKKSDSYFKVMTNDIATRKEPPHILRIVSNCNNKEFENKLYIDTLDNYISNINTSVSKTIINIDSISKKTKLEVWQNE